MQQHPKSKRSLKARLQQAAATIQVDVFGYEKRSTQNIQQYFKKLAAETGIPSKELILRIYEDQSHIRLCIYHKGILKKELQLAEFIRVFTGEYSNFLGLEHKVSTGVFELLTQWATRHKVRRSQLQFCIVCSEEQAWINVYGVQGYLGELPLKTLIKKFTS